ncbi:hypothetical protein [Peribacillus frigoritolerans]|uniref:hypothetical protein n=1 Tax=Peribacillus frigoritolerans TaxID=450367 RepID=UPI003305C05F
MRSKNHSLEKNMDLPQASWLRIKGPSGTKFIPYSKEFAQKQVQMVQATITDIARSGKPTLKNIGEEIGEKEIPKRIIMEQVSLAGGTSLCQVVMEKQTTKEAYQKFAVKDSKVEDISGENIPKGTGKGNRLKVEDVTKENLETKPMNSPIPEKRYKRVGKSLLIVMALGLILTSLEYQ